MANIVYTNFLKLLLSGTIDLSTDPIYVVLLSGSYNPSTGHALLSDVIAHQSYDPLQSYKSGGAALASKTVLGLPNTAYFDAADISWASATITCSGAALYYSGATAATKYLISYIDLGNQSSTNGTFQIVWNNTYGLFRIYGA